MPKHKFLSHIYISLIKNPLRSIEVGSHHTLVVFGLIVASILLASHHVTPVSAYTASITTASSISLNVSPFGNGTSIYAESINVQSDCRSGYNLTIATPNGSNLYPGGDSTETASFTAVDGTSALNSSNNTNKWGYTLTTDATSSTVFSPLSATESILRTSSQTASATDIDDTLSIYYGVKVDNTVVPGSYQMANNSAIVYYLTMDTTCTQYTVSFNANGGIGTIADQGIQAGVETKLTSADALTPPTGGSYTDADNNTITGDPDKAWTFWGWNTEVDGTGDWYKDREAVTDLEDAGNTITLYAQWAQPTLADLTTSTPSGTEKTIDHNEMQDMSPAACYNSDITTAVNAPAATLLDYRGKVITDDPLTTEQPEQYTVSKLADGLCWMTTNLNLGRASVGENEDGAITLTSDDTDLATSTTFTLPAGDTASYTATGNLAKIRLTNTNSANANGVYYTWSAAVANTSSISTNPTTSICPKNWDLPASAQYTNLRNKSSYSSSNLTTAAPSTFLATGGFTNGLNFYGATNYGHYWSSTSSSNTAAYYAYLSTSALTVSNSTGTSTSAGGNKYYRKNIRCVASQGTATINFNGNNNDGGSTASQENIEINSTNLRSNGFTRTHYSFKNWNTAADGSGTTVANSAALSTLGLKPGSTTTLYAQWTPQRQIIYNDNCSYDNTGCATNQDTTNTSNWTNAGSRLFLGSNTYFTTRSGYAITSWNTARDGSGISYSPSSSYTVPSNLSNPDQVTLYAKWGPRYTIIYNGNNATGGSMVSRGTELKHTNINEGISVNLYAPNYYKTNYGFVGWSPSPTATVGGTDPIYGPNETISAPSYDTYGQEISGTKTITLYAIWLEANSSKTMQTFTTTDCQNLSQTTYNSTTGKITAPAGSVIALKDQRDNNVYTVARLADGNCWMTENLRLETENTVGNNQFDSSITNESLAQGYGGVFIGLDSTENSNFTDTTNATPNNMYNSTNITGSYPGSRFPRYNNDNTNTSLTASYEGASEGASSWYSFGNYYTWAAAMANTTHYSSYSGANGSDSAGTSICPTNWSLPLGANQNASGSFYYLNQQMGKDTSTQGSKEWRTFPNNFLYSGFFDVSTAYLRGEDGFYWSRSASSNYESHNFTLTFTWELDLSGAVGKYLGLSVRCLIGP